MMYFCRKGEEASLLPVVMFKYSKVFFVLENVSFGAVVANLLLQTNSGEVTREDWGAAAGKGPVGWQKTVAENTAWERVFGS